MRCYYLFPILMFAATANAQTAYVTDNLRLGIHRAADTSDRAFRTLESGQELEVLSQTTNYANVRLPDGTTGYVRTTYLVTEKPAKLIVQETQARVQQLEGELNQLKEAYREPGEMIATLESELQSTRAELNEALIAADELKTENSRYRRRHEQFKSSVPLSWVGGVAALCVVIGVFGGMFWLDHRSRKRHGGIRLY